MCRNCYTTRTYPNLLIPYKKKKPVTIRLWLWLTLLTKVATDYIDLTSNKASYKQL